MLGLTSEKHCKYYQLTNKIAEQLNLNKKCGSWYCTRYAYDSVGNIICEEVHDEKKPVNIEEYHKQIEDLYNAIEGMKKIMKDT